ncbi:unnamed protein product [Brassica rapa subsp. narinosa]
MDGCSGKRSVNRMVLPRKASGTVLLRENMSKKDEKSVSFCSRIGCSAKVSYTKGTRMVNNTKLGSSSNGKEIRSSSSHSRPSSNSGPSPSRSLVSQDSLSRYNINIIAEELLALGDKMGTVSTALSEEALLRSLQKSIYQETDETVPNSLNKDDIKCSICQEEYVDGDEVGTMPCEHMYHVSCVQRWLRMKNWCPICKTSAEEEKSL